MLLANFYFWYFAAVSIFIAFFNIYVKHLGFSSFEISVLASLHPLARVLWPPFWGHLADRSGRRDRVAAAVNLTATAVFGAYFFADRFLTLFIVQLVFTFFWSTVLPLMEATSLEQASLGRIDYGRSRMWGSVGFILASLAIGPLLDRLGISFALWTILGCLFLSSFSTLFTPRPEIIHSPQPGSLRIFLGRPEVKLFFFVGMLCQLSHATMYNFLSIHLETVGYSNNLIGALWAFGVICEVPVIRWSTRLIDRFGRLHLMTFALFMATIRWLIMSVTTAYPLLLFAQGMHAITFGMFHVAAVTHAFALAPPHLRARGQALYSGLSFGVGISIGMLVNGAVYDTVGAGACFAGSAVVALAAALLSLKLHEKPAAPA
ncbi:MAG: MFS transporter [Deltaproteobacteria bacterium]|nr:MFS transporter [Deltaproteobacteria bacterium]